VIHAKVPAFMERELKAPFLFSAFFCGICGKQLFFQKSKSGSGTITFKQPVKE
jgi:hypothetical protein